MRPFVVDRILKPDGSILLTKTATEDQPGSQPRHGGRPDRHDGARRGVGDGHRGPDSGIRVAGKTGTAEPAEG